MASEIGLNLPTFKACLDSETSRTAVLNDVQEARRLGINGTPTFIINGTPMRGAHNFDDFNAIIARKLKTSQPTLTQN